MGIVSILLLASAQAGEVADQGIELLDNGSFEASLAGWSTYLNSEMAYTGYSKITRDNFHSGTHSLETSAFPRTTYPYRQPSVFGGGASQTVERGDLTFNMVFSFWVFPVLPYAGFAGLPAASLRAWLTVHTLDPLRKASTFTIIYHIAWTERDLRSGPADQASVFLRDIHPLLWNQVTRDVKQDFEITFGAASQLHITKVEVSLDLAYVDAVGVMASRDGGMVAAYWDDVSLRMVKLPSQQDSSIPTQKTTPAQEEVTKPMPSETIRRDDDEWRPIAHYSLLGALLTAPALLAMKKLYARSSDQAFESP